jgi:hypothetical protein
MSVWQDAIAQLDGALLEQLLPFLQSWLRGSGDELELPDSQAP